MKLISVEEAQKIMLHAARPGEIEIISLAQAGGRILAQDLAARRTQPPFPASAMDGFALRAQDGSPAPALLKLIGESSAGHAFDGTLGAGEAVRIHTGAPVPAGADAIVPIEQARAHGKQVEVLAAIKKGTFVRPAGLDFKAGDILLPRGAKLNARAIGLAAAMNHVWLPVYRRIRAAVLASGDELVRPGEPMQASQIISANHIALKIFLEAHGAMVIDLPFARDNPESTGHLLRVAAGLDLLITIGGVSVGGRDLMRPELEKQGFKPLFHGVSMVPGKPLLFGLMDKMPVMGLPGNPVSALVAAEIFLRPLLVAMGGQKPVAGLPHRQQLPLAAALHANEARQAYLRGEITSSGVRAFQGQDSARLALLAKADCLILRPPFAPAAERGAAVEVLLL